jgi:hypothetical protein
MIALVDRLLRGREEFAAERAARAAARGGPRALGRVPWSEIATVVVVAGALHGAAIGSFGLRAEQSWYSALKLPLLIAGSTALCVPSFYALNTVIGLREDFGAALRGVLCTQATVAAVLASLAPVVLVEYLSSASYRAAMLANGLAFLVASACGQAALARHYRPLVARNRRHALARAAWLVLYWFVTIQLAWVLRPFVGAPGLEPQFLRPEAWSNAYVALARAFLRL